MQQLGRAVAQQNPPFVHMPQPRQRCPQRNGLGLGIAPDGLEGIANRMLQPRRRTQWIDARLQSAHTAHVPAALPADREHVAAVPDRHRRYPTLSRTINAADPYSSLLLPP